MGESVLGGEAFSHCPGCGRRQEDGHGVCAGCGYNAGDALGTGLSGDGPADDGQAVSQERGVTWGGGQIIAAVILVLLALFTSALVASVIASLYPEQEDAVATWIAVHVMALSIITTIWFLGLRRSMDPLEALGLKGIRLPRAGTVLLMMGVLATSLIATSLYAGLVERLDLDILSPPEVGVDIVFDGPAALLTFQALAFITPLSEEIFFRGFIFGGLLARLGPWRAIVTSALVFSAFHLSLGVIVPIFITGFLLAWLYWRTGSLWAAIGAHAGQNALALGVQALN